VAIELPQIAEAACRYAAGRRRHIVDGVTFRINKIAPESIDFAGQERREFMQFSGWVVN
jgi:hypothetical protein